MVNNESDDDNRQPTPWVLAPRNVVHDSCERLTTDDRLSAFLSVSMMNGSRMLQAHHFNRHWYAHGLFRRPSPSRETPANSPSLRSPCMAVHPYLQQESPGQTSHSSDRPCSMHQAWTLLRTLRHRVISSPNETDRPMCRKRVDRGASHRLAIHVDRSPGN